MLALSQVSKAYGERTLFSDVTLQVNRTDRIGLVGPNGAGKSTLFSLILGEIEPDDGSVIRERHATFGYLPQETAPAGDETVLHLATDGMPELEPKAKQMLHGLAFRQADFQRPAKALSGGWVMRAHLARLLVQEPDLLLLDEPTNHLDLETLGWFQEYLQYQYRGGILVVSHDRAFLNALCQTVLSIERGELQRYRGNYDEYLVQRAARAEQQLAAYKNQQKQIESLQQFADRFRAKASKASQAQAKLKQIERMDKIDAPQAAERTIHFKFPQPPRSGLRVITLTGVDHSYGETAVYRGLDFAAERGQRTVLVGPNGAGKSTLLKILAGAVEFQRGKREAGLNVNVGYYAQYRVEMLQPDRTVLEEALDTPQRLPEQTVRTVLGSFLFRGDDVFKPVNVLSGGEKSRLALVKLLLNPPNLLLMDEPTTHLDMPSIDALIGALRQFEGTLIFISHDVHFIRALATSVLHINAGQLTAYCGDYQYYLDKSRAVSERGALVAGAPAASVPAAPVKTEPRSREKDRERKRLEHEERQARSQTRKLRQQQVAALEAGIAALETRQRDLAAQLEDPATYACAGKAVAINRDLAHVTDDLAKLTREWETMAATAESASPVGP
jgi:ATP-binding cassette subfamily F protein 3